MSPTAMEGCIMYLPSLDEISLPLGVGSGLPEPKAFDHPVVVLALDSSMQQASILVITSFNNIKLEEKHRKRRIRERYLPLPPANKHPDSGRILKFEHGMELKKPSYIKLTPHYIVPARVLRNLREGPAFVLTETSRHILLEASGLVPRNGGGAGDSTISAPFTRSALVSGYGAMPVTGQTSVLNQQGNLLQLNSAVASRPEPSRNNVTGLPPPVSLWERVEPRFDVCLAPPPKCVLFTLLIVGVAFYVLCVMF